MAQKLFKRILVPTDGSEHSVAAAKLAIRLARVFDATLDIVFVVDTLVADELASFTKIPETEARRQLAETGKHYLSYIAELALSQGLLATRTLREGTPSAEILAVARESSTDLIVMGRVGRKGLKRITVGSVTESVLAGAECPVMITQAK